MPQPIQIADAKISLADASAISELQTEAEAIHRRAAAKGMLHSGNTITQVKDQCISTLKRLGETTSQELQWVLSQTFFASPSIIDLCNAVAHKHINTVGDECVAVLRKTVDLCGDDRHFAITEPELRAQEQQSRMFISLALDSRYSELKFQRMRTVLGYLQRVLQVAVRLGRP